MKQWLMNLFQDANGDADETVLYAFSGILTFIGLAIYAVVIDHKPFDMQAFGIGFGAILAGVFAGYGIKAKLERQPGTTP